MESAEIDIALEELESRLERLRALYEQYFMGIEKLEPAIPRKDVDRRIYVLRREKIRNTGKRFKLQTLISRYNTFQQYWQRICREIENGTYKRHLLRAEKNFGPNQLLTTAARRRFGRQNALRDSQQPAAAADGAAQAEAAAAPATDAASAAASSAQEPAMRPRSRTPTWPGIPTPPPPSGAAPPPPLHVEAIAPVRVPAGIQPLAAASPSPSPMAAALATPAPRAAPSSSPRKPAPFESLELDMDFMGDWDPGTAAKGRSAVGASSSVPERTAARRSPVAQTPPREKPPVATAPAQPRTPEPQPRVVAPPAEPRANAPLPARTPLSSFPLPGETRRLAPPPKPKRDPALAPPPPPASSVPPAQPSAERRPPVQRPPTERPPAPRPASENPAAAAAAAAARARAARPRAAPAEANVTEGKLRELHQRLAEVSKGAGQPTVSFDGLSKSLRAAEAKLREKHGNRRIDFEVVLKDGKPVVKPVVR